MSPLPGTRARRTGPLLLALLVVGATVLPGGAVQAHTRSISYSSWQIDDDGAEVTVRLKLLELSRLGPAALPPGAGAPTAGPRSPDLAARAFPRELVMRADGVPCRAPAEASRRPDETGWVRYRWRVECPPGAERRVIESRLLLDVAPSHMHFARVRLEEAPDAIRERVLTEGEPSWEIPTALDEDGSRSPGAGIGDYVALGVEHILTGWDHLAFVFGLLLLARGLGEVARLVTGFTLAHSLTLALAVLDRVQPHSTAVEAVIAFSVALVATEKLWLLSDRSRGVPVGVALGIVALGIAAVLGGSPLPAATFAGLFLFTLCYFALVARSASGWLRVCLTFAFGLVHGFGFAGVLAEMALPDERLATALLGFNVGVEIGQIGVVLLLWPLLRAGTRLAPLEARRWATEAAAAGLAGIGVFWLVERAFSG